MMGFSNLLNLITRHIQNHVDLLCVLRVLHSVQVEFLKGISPGSCPADAESLAQLMHQNRGKKFNRNEGIFHHKAVISTQMSAVAINEIWHSRRLHHKK